MLQCVDEHLITGHYHINLIEFQISYCSRIDMLRCADGYYVLNLFYRQTSDFILPADQYVTVRGRILTHLHFSQLFYNKFLIKVTVHSSG
jgi:hypothetical protein